MKREHLVDASGRREIYRVLSTHDKPQEAILELQATLGLSNPALDPALAFLDVLGVPRPDVYHYLADSLKDTLLSKIRNAPINVLEVLLNETFRFIAVADLKNIPISIISRMSRIPEVYLKALSDKRLRGTFDEFPINVRRQILESNPSFFLEIAEPLLQSLRTINDLDARKSDAKFENLCDMICGSEKLFIVTCEWLSKQIISTGMVQWSSVLRQMLIIIDGRGKKVLLLSSTECD